MSNPAGEDRGRLPAWHAVPLKQPYTLLMSGSPSYIIVPAMMSPPPYDGIADFTPIAMIATMPNLIVVKPSLPVTSVKSLIDYAKANPGKLFYGSAGNGSIGPLATELLKQLAGIDMAHVPCKGAASAVVDLLGGPYVVAASAVAGCITDPRLMLAEREKAFPCGLAGGRGNSATASAETTRSSSSRASST